MLEQNQKEKIEQINGYNFKDKNLLQTAFTHSSFAYTHGVENNERLEFLGDSVLNFCTTQFLYHNFDYDEGVSSKIRAYLVSSEYVSKYVSNNMLETFLLCDNFDPKKSTNVMGDLYEAIIGAILRDGGIDECKKFIYASLQYSKTLIEDVHSKVRDYKTELQEFLQKSGEIDLEYVLLHREGPAHCPTFTIQTKIAGKAYASASAKSKKEAENLSAKQTLEMLKNK